MTELDADLQEVVDQTKEDLIRTLEKGDESVMMLLRFHLFTENMLERIMLGKLPRGDRVIDKGQLTYYQKLWLVASFEIVSDRAIRSLENLNALRNKCTHQRDRRISLSDVEPIGRPFGNQFARIKRDFRDDLKRLITAVFAAISGNVAAAVYKAEHKQ